MELNEEFFAFINEHLYAYTDRLLFSASRYHSVDVAKAVEQILIRRRLKTKLPAWTAHEKLFFPSRIAAEQCSSDITAKYKQSLIKGATLCDLTGGMGVDAYYFSQCVERVTYVERNTDYAEAAARNFEILGATNIQVLNADATEIAPRIEAVTFYIDPARRSAANKRLFALHDCEPDVLQMKAALLNKGARVIIKVSPMADIEETLRLLPETCEVHIISVGNECKELLFVLENAAVGDVNVFTINYTSAGDVQQFRFHWNEEKTAQADYASEINKYLYEPNASVMKSGAFKLAAARYSLKKLHRHSHLYTSSELTDNFAGRIFSVEEVLPFSKQTLKTLSDRYPQANITCRNFPLTTDTLRQRMHIKDGGNVYIFATTFASDTKVIIVARRG
ncbi:MAG: class I SAM-dependent methyltransferase [Culturomica sp.]|jgi:precorrin-6B methylase 2|nr:class I SAM-dependent methyltransferase [Culturomica sp.]